MKVRVYGFSHSPWVQAVLLALHNKKIDHSLSQNPPLEVFAKWGVYMPAISFDEGPWEMIAYKLKLMIPQNERRDKI